jgi:hypothetical protein
MKIQFIKNSLSKACLWILAFILAYAIALLGNTYISDNFSYYLAIGLLAIVIITSIFEIKEE